MTASSTITKTPRPTKYALSETADLIEAKDRGLLGLASAARVTLELLDDPIAVKSNLQFIVEQATRLAQAQLEDRL